MLAEPLLSLLNRLIDAQPALRALLVPHAGKQAALSIGGLGLRFAIAPAGQLAQAEAGRTPDVSIDIPASALPYLAEGTTALQARAQVSGDAGLADVLGRLAGGLRPDIGGWLSPVLGDILANRVEQGLQALAGVATRGVSGLAANVSEYLQEESRLVVRAAELQGQTAERTQLDERLAALERRLARLT